MNTTACRHLVTDLNALADGQLDSAAVAALVTHTQACEGCNGTLDGLRRMSELHRRAAALLGAELLDDLPDLDHDDGRDLGLDAATFVGKVLGRACDDEWTLLARLFYELGKAYVLEGNQRLPATERRIVTVRETPADIRRTERRALERLGRVDALSARGAGEGADRHERLRGRSRRLLQASSRARAAALLKGRRFLEEALALRPGLDEARIYLGFALLLEGRIDRARTEFRRVQREGSQSTWRLMATQWLGNVAVNTSRLDEAVACYAAVVADASARREPRLFSSFLNLPVTLVKLGRSEEAVTHFNDLVESFPERLGQVREQLAGMTVLRRLLDEDLPLRRTLHDRVPGLFAAA